MNLPDKKIIILSTVFVSVLMAFVLLLPRFLHLETFRPLIVETLKNSLHREVYYSSGTVSVGWGIHFNFKGVRISGGKSDKPLASADSLSITIPLLPLLKGNTSAVRKIELENPTINIERYADGKTSIDDLLQPGSGGATKLHHISVNGGELNFSDGYINLHPLYTRISDISLDLREIIRGKTGKAHLKCLVNSDGKSGYFELKGKLNIPKTGNAVFDSFFNGKVITKDLDPWHFWDYFKTKVAFKKPTGRLSLSADCKGSLKDFESDLKLHIKSTIFDFPSVFHAVLKPANIDTALKLSYRNETIEIPYFNAKVDGVEVKGDFRISSLKSGNPKITAHATTNQMDLQKFGGYIPFGIITKDVSDWIEQHVKGGKLTLEHGVIDGTVNQILNIGVGTNYNILDIAATIENGTVIYGSTMPAFTKIKGKLALKGKDFILTGMTGFFGTSPLKMDGRITEYVPTPIPCAFPFKMEITPKQSEIAWIAGKDVTEKVKLSGDSTLFLSGDGPTSKYLLSGSWKLDKSAISYSDIFNKQAGVPASASFSASLAKEGIDIPKLKLQLNSAIVSSSVKIFFNDKSSRYEVKTYSNRFSFLDIAPYFPLSTKYSPSGFATLNVSATGNDLKKLSQNLEGAVELTDAAVTVTDKVTSTKNISGTLLFRPGIISSKNLQGGIGTDRVTLSGRYNYNKNALSGSFSSPSLTPENYGFINPPDVTGIINVSGNVDYSGDKLLISNASARINSSPFNFSINADISKKRKITAKIHSPFIDLNDILAISKLEEKNPQKSAPENAGWDFNSELTADNGKVGDIRFSNLKSTFEVLNSVLYLRPFSFDFYGGAISGGARIDFAADKPRYQVDFDAKNVETSKLLPALGFNSQKIKGGLKCSANLTCRGKNFNECKSTLLGAAKLNIGKGSIDKFSVLSKLFSILNVSQLLKFRLPDMVKDGMPFKQIKSVFAIKDGIISTEDFVIDSEAMKISAVGSYSLSNDRIKSTIGVQPLQSIDSFVSRIPVVGWILTGKERKLITAYFEAKGTAEDPEVNAVPVKSIAEGTLDIFMRIFSLPAKLVTDTGEVILNR